MVRDISLENHLTLATMRAGHGTAETMIALLRLLYLGYFVAEHELSRRTMRFSSKSKLLCCSASKLQEKAKHGKCQMMRWTPCSACCCARTRLSAAFPSIATSRRGTSSIASHSHPTFRPFRAAHCRR